MRIGLYIAAAPQLPVEILLERFERAEERGFHTAWVGQLFDHDALTLLALAGLTTSRIELGTWVVPALSLHPVVLARQVLTVQAASRHRLVLGIGAGHRAIVEDRLGLDHSKPVRRMREFLAVLKPLLRGEPVDHEGEAFRVRLQVGEPGAEPPPVLLAALGPQMLRLAGRRADGAAIWLGGPRYLETFALPPLCEAARASGRPPPRVVAGLPVAVTSDVSRARQSAEAFLAPSSKLPSYRRVLEREDAPSPGSVAILGEPEDVARRLEQLARIGVTDFNAVPFPVEDDPETESRTIDFLGELARHGVETG